MLLLAVLVTLVVSPWRSANRPTLATPEHISRNGTSTELSTAKYFRSVRAFFGIIACSVPFLLLLLWPFLTALSPSEERPLAVGGFVGLIAALVLGVLGHLSETEQTFFGRRYHIDHYGRPHRIDDDAPHDDSTHEN